MSYKQRAKSVGMAKKKIKGHFLINLPFEFTPKQKEVINLLLDEKTRCCFISGEAGTGKTLISIFAAMKLIQQGDFEKLVYVRNIIESSHASIGLLPGSIEEKTAPYMEPLLDHLHTFFTPDEVIAFQKSETVKGIPCSFLRGKNMADKTFVIVDEAQNLTHKDLVTIATRICEGAKILFLFDPYQSDIRNTKNRNDIVEFANIFNTVEAQSLGIFFRAFDETDIMRSAFVKFIVSELKRVGKY
jgi:phosphate starvation-inducible PhoH-like protein